MTTTAITPTLARARRSRKMSRASLRKAMAELLAAETSFERAGMDPCRAYYATLHDYTVAFHWSRRIVIRGLNAIMDARTGTHMYHDRAYPGWVRLARAAEGVQ